MFAQGDAPLNRRRVREVWRFHRIDLVEDKTFWWQFAAGGREWPRPRHRCLHGHRPAARRIGIAGAAAAATMADRAPFRREYARRIDENDLCLAFQGNPTHEPRRLNLTRKRSRPSFQRAGIDQRRLLLRSGHHKGDETAACSPPRPLFSQPLWTSWRCSRAMKAAARLRRGASQSFASALR